MAIASGIIVAWPSGAAIPAGWNRETGLDAKYIRGAAAAADADLTTAFGVSTHVHTSPDHTPIQAGHMHSLSAAGASSTVTATTAGTTVSVAAVTHPHPAADSGSTVAVNNSVAITVDGNTSNDLGYVEVVWIKSDGTPTGIPVGGWAFFESDTLPASWSRVSGDTHLKGAVAATPPGAPGGSNAHNHTSPAHTHIQVTHLHGGTSAANTGNVNRRTGAGSAAAPASHVHDGGLATIVATNQAVTTTVANANHEPPYKKLNVIENGAGAADLPDQVIALWGGTAAAAAALTDWSRFTDFDDLFPKGANADGESNVTTGGSTSHVHSADDCQPVQDGHTHTKPDGLNRFQTILSGASTASKANHFADHVWTVSTVAATNNAVTVTIDANTSESAYPPYAKVIFLRYTSPAPAVAPSRFFLVMGQ